MKKTLLILLISIGNIHVFSQPLPVPDHIVIAIFENHAFSQIQGSSSAPYINGLYSDVNSAVFTQSYGVEHPSQPNYLDLFSGCNQGITDDNVPVNTPFTMPNLGRQLLDAGKTFKTFSEDLPSVGYNGAASGNYARKHNPASNWMGTGTNQIPASTNQPFSAFPSDFTQLPTVSLVIPNQNDDMHNGTDPSRISSADSWFYAKLNSYVQWAKSHNSLFILTFDEDDDLNGNHILTIFSGQMVTAGQYQETINHYSILRTVEDMYGLPHACNAATAHVISDVWNSGITADITTLSASSKEFIIYPNPAKSSFTISFKNSSSEEKRIFIYDITGKLVQEQAMQQNEEKINCNLTAGVYLVRIKLGEKYFTEKLAFHP